jgi:hypothetical protein
VALSIYGCRGQIFLYHFPKPTVLSWFVNERELACRGVDSDSFPLNSNGFFFDLSLTAIYSRDCMLPSLPDFAFPLPKIITFQHFLRVGSFSRIICQSVDVPVLDIALLVLNFIQFHEGERRKPDQLVQPILTIANRLQKLHENICYFIAKYCSSENRWRQWKSHQTITAIRKLTDERLSISVDSEGG